MRNLPQKTSGQAPAPEVTLSKAVKNAAQLLNFKQSALAEILGVSAPTASRLFSGTYILDPGRKKEWELALLFVRMFRSLDAILGHESQAQKWLTGENTALNGCPINLMRTTEGLIRVLQYLDAYRGRI